jgi:hypothetical protein
MKNASHLITNTPVNYYWLAQGVPGTMKSVHRSGLLGKQSLRYLLLDMIH